MGMQTTATLSADGKSYALNGAKMWITNGTIDGKTTGDIFLVYAKTGKGRAASDLTSFLVEKGTPGFTVGQKIQDKCGMRASMTAELVFDNVVVCAIRDPYMLHYVNQPIACIDCCDVYKINLLILILLLLSLLLSLCSWLLGSC